MSGGIYKLKIGELSQKGLKGKALEKAMDELSDPKLDEKEAAESPDYEVAEQEGKKK